MNKIVFLDIDGVLNNASTRPRDPQNLGDWIDEPNLIVANELVVRTGADVVVSSAWRHGRDARTLDRALAARGFVGEVIGLTPVLLGRPRWMEIHAWLGSRRTDAYLILDDIADMGGLAHRHVCPSPAQGFTAEELPAAISCLGGEVNGPALFFRPAQRPFGALSNFSPHPVVLDGAFWPTAEHAYQAQKLAPGPERAAVAAALTPHEAKQVARARRDAWRADWDDVKEDVMRAVLTAKFRANPVALGVLLATGVRPLAEASRHDAYWGLGADGRGRNRLGALLMDLRAAERGAGGRI
jgi:ribA/ribD-fused uncharacterized protein